jgi:hypothetical protein
VAAIRRERLVGWDFWCADSTTAREATHLTFATCGACHAGRHVFIGASHFSIMGMEGTQGTLVLAVHLEPLDHHVVEPQY